MKGIRSIIFPMILVALVSFANARVLVIGQVAEFAGIGNANENSAGARLWFEHASAQGPHKYVIKALDDQRDPKLTVTLTRKLAEEDKVVALFGYRSTPSLEAVAPLLNELQLPLVGPFNGSDSVRRKAGQWMFFLRATYLDEMDRLVGHVHTVGMRKVAIVHQQDSFGTEAAKAFAATLEAKGIRASGLYSYDRKTLDTSDAVKGLLETQPEAVLMACTARACAEIIRKVRETNRKMILLTLSNAVNDELLKAIAEVGRGVVMSQVMPFPWNNNVPMVKEFTRLNSLTKSKVPLSHAALEGFAAAKLLTLVAARAGPQADAQRIAEVLRTTAPFASPLTQQSGQRAASCERRPVGATLALNLPNNYFFPSLLEFLSTDWP